MKKINTIKISQNGQIKNTHAFSKQKNKNWKKPKWDRNTSVKVYKSSGFWKKKRRRTSFKIYYFRNIRKFRIKGIRYYKWRKNIRRQGKTYITLLKKLQRKTRFWRKHFRVLFSWTKRVIFLTYFYYKKINKKQVINKVFPVRNKNKSKFFKKKHSLSINFFLHQPSLYFFRKNYKKRFLKKSKDKSLFLKSLEINLIKFSLIDDLNWCYFFTRNHLLFKGAYRYYDYVKSKRIKEFFDIFTKHILLNQIKQIKIHYSKQYFQYIHNNQTNFEDLTINKQKFPWWEPLIFTKQTYKNRVSWRGKQFWFHKPFLLYTFKFYYRYKKPWEEKKKSLYKNFSYLVFNMHDNNVLEKPKRVKQLLNKIVLPFYGHIKPKQLHAIYKRSHFVKSKAITSSNLFLNKLETRIDVLVYRLNLAPNIIWARRLIRAGLIFLQQKESKKYIKDCFQKKHRYPVKLNNLFDLYPPSLNDARIKKFYFKSQPILNINFRAKPGDIIQCHPFSLYQKWNIRPDLLNKPIPNYLLTRTKKDLNTEWNHWYHYLINNKKYLLLYNAKKKNRWKKNKNFAPYRFEWGNDLCKETTSFFLFNPQRKDFYVNDRNSSLFLNWAVQ